MTKATDNAVPASAAQERMWAFAQREAGDASYHVPIALRLRGALDVAAAHAALQQLVTKHESLRTRFVFTDEKLEQHIASALDIALPVRDLTSASADAVSSAFSRLAAQPFDLETG